MDNRFYFGFNTSEERKKRRKAELYSMSEQVSTFFWDEAPQHGLEMREGQQDMSFEIVDALINDQHFAIEAGVGIGKSFGYLVPVLLYSKRMNKPVIIATSTIALQEQLWRDVHAVMPLLGLNRDVILAKGQTHYLCNKRADEYMCDPKADPPDALKEGIRQGYEERKDFPEVLPQGVWDKVNVQRFSMKNCGSCEKKCKYYKVRASLKYTDGVVLCNQDFLTQHLMKLRRGQDGLINAAADLLVVDEAHNLDDKVRSATTERFGQGTLFGMIKSAFYELRPSDQSSVSGEKREAESAIIAFYNCLKAQVQKQIDDADQDMRYADRFFFDQSGSAVELLTEMNAAIHNLSSSIQIYSSMDFRNNRSFAASDDLDAVSESLSELLDQIDDMLIWIEQHGSNTELVYCPKNTKEIVSRLYFNGDERTILTSATLTNATSGSLEEQYSYFISNTGFPAGDRCIKPGVILRGDASCAQSIFHRQPNGGNPRIGNGIVLRQIHRYLSIGFFLRLPSGIGRLIGERLDHLPVPPAQPPPYSQAGQHSQHPQQPFPSPEQPTEHLFYPQLPHLTLQSAPGFPHPGVRLPW